MTGYNPARAKAAEAALAYIKDTTVIGVGSGNTVEYFIQALAPLRGQLDGCIPTSEKTASLLRTAGLPVMELNAVSQVPIYIDSTDEITERGFMIKGGGGALTREKILASASKQFICIADEKKLVKRLGVFPVALEVIPMARSYVARQCLAIGAQPQYREGFVTDNGNIILDLFQVDCDHPLSLEETLNNIPGVVENGIFAKRTADILLLANENNVRTFRF